MAGAKMVDKTNMSLDDIIKMDRKNTRKQPKRKPAAFAGNFNKTNAAKNVIRKARNSVLNRKINLISPKKKFDIVNKRIDVRSRLMGQKNSPTKTINNVVKPQIQSRLTKYPKFTRPNNNNNVNRPRITRNNSNSFINSAQAFRITTNNERYQQINSTRGRPNSYNNSSNGNFNSAFLSARNGNQSAPMSRRGMLDRAGGYYGNRRNESAGFQRSTGFSRDREYEAMARALIEAHRESRYAYSQQQMMPAHVSSYSQPSFYPTRRYNPPMDSRGYYYRR